MIQKASVIRGLFCSADSRDGCRHAYGLIGVRMRKSVAGSVAAVKPPLRAATWNNQPTTIVCAGLMLAILALAFRIATVW
jgi:hypothetical protein